MIDNPYNSNNQKFTNQYFSKYTGLFHLSIFCQAFLFDVSGLNDRQELVMGTSQSFMVY